MAGSRQFHAFPHQLVEVHRRAVKRAFLSRRCARFQHLFDGMEQALGIEVHHFVELAALRLIYFASLQGLEVEADGSDRGLQVTSDGVDEAVMLLVAANLADQKNRIKNKTGYDGSE